MRFLQNLKTKYKVAEHIIKDYIKDEKHLVFGSSIEMVEKMCKYTFHSKTDDKDFNKFVKGKVKQLGCIKALNEGVNIPDLDSAIITAYSSNPLETIQRIGRVVRVREGHQATIWILCCLETQEVKWLDKALEGFDKSVVEYINYKNL